MSGTTFANVSMSRRDRRGLRYGKHLAPRISAYHVRRDRLVSLVDGALRDSSLFVVAPLGFGKTSLMAEWLAAGPSDAVLAWTTLDEGDDGVEALLTAVLESIPPNGGAPAGMMVRSREASNDGDAIEELVRALYDAASEHDASLVICLDGCERLSDEDALVALSDLVACPPPNVHFALLSRREHLPSIPLLVERGMLLMIDGSDLRFTEADSAEFFRLVAGRYSNEGELRAFAAYVDGWPAAARLEVPNLLGSSASNAAPYEPVSNHARVLDPLFNSELSKRPGDLVDFVACTATLDRMSEPLLEAALGDLFPHPNEMLHAVLDEHLFVYPSDERGRWYRYHARFLDYLRECGLGRTFPIDARSIHLRAGDWYAGRPGGEHLTEAITHYQRAGAWDEALDLVERHGPTMITRSWNCDLVMSWMRGFPRSVIKGRPLVQFLRAVSQLNSVRGAESSLLRSYFDEGYDANGGNAGSGDFEVTFGMLMDSHPNRDLDPTVFVEASKVGLEAVGLDNAFSAGVVFAEGTAYASLRMVDEARVCFERERKIALRIGALGDIAASGYYEALTAMKCGCHEQALSILRREKKRWATVVPASGADSDFASFFDLGIALALVELGRFAEAERSFALVGDGWVGGGLAHFSVDYLIGKHRLLWARGRYEEATAVLEDLAMTLPDYAFVAEIILERNRLLLGGVSGDSRARVSCSPFHAGGIHTPGFGPLGAAETYFKAYLTWARVQTLSGAPDAALEYLQPQLALDEAAGLYGRVLEEKVEISLALQALGRMGEAKEAMAEALRLGSEQRSVCAFCGSSLTSALMIQAATTREARDFVQHVLDCQEGSAQRGGVSSRGERIPQAGAGSRDAGPNAAAEGSALLSDGLDFSGLSSVALAQLSEREREVLALIAEGMSNKAIGATLHISTGTVKVHITNILRKLGVSNRVQAANLVRR